MIFDNNRIGQKSNRDKFLAELLKSPVIMASEISTISLPENPNERCERLKLLIQEKQAGINFDMIIEEIAAIADKLLEYECISTKQHNFC